MAAIEGPMSEPSLLLHQNWVLARVPQDMWRIIFGMCVEDAILEKSFYTPTYSAEVAPLLLCQICSTWRNLATSYPELWTHISLEVDPDNVSVPDKNIIDIFIQRSQGQPMALSITKRTDPEQSEVELSELEQSDWFLGPFEPSLKEVIRAMLKAAPRAKDLALSISILESIFLLSDPLYFADFNNSVQAPNECHAKRLELVGLINDHGFGYVAISRANWPNLEELNIRAKDITFLYIPTIPFGQLTEISLNCSDGMVISDILDIVSFATSLVRFTAVGLRRTDNPLPASRAEDLVKLQHLRHLHLENIAHDFMGSSTDDKFLFTLTTVLEYLETPSLQSLALIEDYGCAVKIFSSFLARSKCKIEEFTWKSWNVKEKQKIRCLRAMPHIKILKFPRIVNEDEPADMEDSWLTDIFFEALKKWDSSNSRFNMLPQLEYLELGYTELLVREDSTSCPDAIQMRMRHPLGPAHALKKVAFFHVETLMLNDSLFTLHMLRLLILKRDGLDITFDKLPDYAEHLMSPA